VLGLPPGPTNTEAARFNPLADRAGAGATKNPMRSLPRWWALILLGIIALFFAAVMMGYF
jgi:hypothetical protein